MNIQLHSTLGVNPHLCVCPRCGGDNGELVLIGTRTNKLKCRQCGVTVFGHRTGEPCPKCGQRHGDYEKLGRIEEGEKVPSGLCDDCKKEVKEHKAIVAEGGIYWKCAECHREGVIKATSPICGMVRKKMNIEVPEPCGIEFNKCEEHTPKET